MGKRGPKPLHLMTDGLEPAFVDSRPPIPLTRLAAREWRRLIGHLTKTRTLAEQELATLAIHCEALAGVVECDKAIRQEGLLVDGRGGVKVKNPLLTARAAYVDQAIKTARELALTPSTRVSMRPIEDIADDPVERKYFSHLDAADER